MAWTSYLKGITRNLFLPPLLPEGSVLSTYSKLAAGGLAPSSRSVLWLPLDGLHRKFASLPKLPELWGKAPFCRMQTRRNPHASLYTPEITRELLAFSFLFYFFSFPPLWIVASRSCGFDVLPSIFTQAAAAAVAAAAAAAVRTVLHKLYSHGSSSCLCRAVAFNRLLDYLGRPGALLYRTLATG